MTLNILFLSITIKKRQVSVDEALQEQMNKKLMEEHYNRQFYFHNRF